jgi:phosphoribosyl 1,2-cyclic phosphate phosphodiesterase
MSEANSIRITILGSGTSTGVPMPGCSCSVCMSNNQFNKRLRTSAMISWGEHNIVIDTGPDFREQMLKSKVSLIDAVLFTHGHADHLLGIDDLRPFYFKKKKAIPCYGNTHALDQIKKIFFYIFERDPSYIGGGLAELQLNIFNDFETININGLNITPFPLWHGNLPVHGFKVGDFAYATDCKSIPEKSKELLYGTKTMVLDGLRMEKHPTHMTITEAISTGKELGIEKLYLIHMSHAVDHDLISQELPDGVMLCYDGLIINVSA